jgi:hypothetical protein
MAYRVLKQIYGIVHIGPGHFKVNCSEEIYTDCHAKALAHLKEQQLTGQAKVFVYAK